MPIATPDPTFGGTLPPLVQQQMAAWGESMPPMVQQQLAAWGSPSAPTPPPAASAGSLSPYAQQLQSVQASAAKPIGTQTPQWVQKMAAIKSEAPKMFSRPTDVAAPMSNLTPRGPAPSLARAVASTVPAPGPMYGPPSLPPQFRAGPGGVQTPQMGSTIMQALTGSRPAPPSATAQFASKIPRIGGTQLNPANIKPSGGAGAWLGRLGTASVPLFTGQAIAGLGDMVDSDALRAGGSATSLFGTAAALGGAGAAPATIIPAAGVASGELGGNMVTRALGRVLNGENPDSLNPGINFLANSVGIADELGIIPEFLREPMARGERGLGDIPIVQDLFNLTGGGESEGESSAPRQVLPAELPDVMSSLGVSQEIQQTALSQMDQDMALYRVYAERGMPIPGDVDADGKPVVRDPSEIEGLVTARFLQSLPELVDMEREQQSALARAAMFQATMGDMMAPYQDASNALADSYGPMLAGIEGVAPELQGPLADYAAALAAQTRGNAAAYGAMGMAVPATVGLEQYMARQEAMQNRLAAMQMQAEIDAMKGTAATDATEADILG